MTRLIGPESVRALRVPPSRSHKGDNGVLTVIGGSRRYHGAPILAVRAANRFCDLVFFHSPERENNELVRKLKLATTDVIVVGGKDLTKALERSDCILLGNGAGATPATKRFVNSLLHKYGGKKFVLDADALKVVDKKLFGPNVVVTPHAREFEILFGVKPSEKNVSRCAKRFGCVIVLKGRVDLISDGRALYRNATGNAGMTKGGTGDVLAGLCAALACKNPPLLAAQAACFLNGFAGDLLAKRFGFAFNAGDLAGELPAAFARVALRK